MHIKRIVQRSEKIQRKLYSIRLQNEEAIIF